MHFSFRSSIISPHVRNFQPGKHDLAITRHAVGRALTSPDFGLDTFEHVNNSLTQAERDIHFGPLTQAQAAIAKSVIDYLAANKGLDKVAALNTTQAIDKLTQKSNVPEKADALKIPIEQVAEYARLELEQIIQDEARNNVGPVNLTPLERAILNLTVVNGWVNDKTWLCEFLARRNIYVVLWPLASRVGFPLGNRLRLTQEGVKVQGKHYDMATESDVTHYYVVTAKYLQEVYDKGYTDNVSHLASIDRVKAAEKILKNIK